MATNLNKNGGFGTWMTQLANKADPATSATLDALKEKLEKERQEKLEVALRRVFRGIEENVKQLAYIRRQEDAAKKRIKDWEELADKLVSGKINPEDVTSYGFTESVTLGELLRSKL